MTSFSLATTADEVINAFADRIKNRCFVITGTSAGGLGASTATTLARKSPAHLVLVSRNKSKVDPVIAEILSTNSAIKVTFVQCELSDLDSVRKAADEISAAVEHIDVIINNAGVMNLKKYAKSPQGVEMTLASNYLGHFLLTNLLMAKLKAAGPDARVVNLSSTGHRVVPFKFDDYNFSDGATYDGWSAYGQSKTASILFTVGLAARGVQSQAVNPGLIAETGLASHLGVDDFGGLSEMALRNTGRPFQLDIPKPLDKGTATILVAALSSALDGVPGSYIEDCEIVAPYEYADDKGNAEKLWKLSEKLVGTTF